MCGIFYHKNHFGAQKRKEVQKDGIADEERSGHGGMQHEVAANHNMNIPCIVPPPGFEPGTISLRGSCSTN